MEVHHHPHVPHGTKKAKEYFLEFLMIFLAVTMGFFAESLREHISENKKEREFITGFIADLKADTAKLSAVLKYYDHTIPMADSARKNFYQLQKPGSLHAVSLLQRSLAGYLDFIYTDATLQQIKSSGGMMLIKNKAAVDSILDYDAQVKSALINEKVLGDLLISAQHQMGGILNMQPLLESVGRAKDVAEQKVMVDSLKASMPDFLLTHDPTVLGQFYNDLSYYETVSVLVKTEMAGLKTRAAALIVFLKKEYRLRDDEHE